MWLTNWYQCMRRPEARYGYAMHRKQLRGAGRSFSQFGEDLVVAKIFEAIRLDLGGSFFVDIGAFHPSWISNTYLHYRRGLSGVNVDTADDKIFLFRWLRPRDTSIVRAVVGRGGPPEVTVASPPGYSEVASVLEGNPAPVALDPDFAARGIERHRVRTATIQEVLERAPAAKTFAYLNVDCEGLDETILASIDFRKVRPIVISVEARLPAEHRLDALMRSSMHATLSGHGYLWMSQCGLTSIYVEAGQARKHGNLWV